MVAPGEGLEWDQRRIVGLEHLRATGGRDLRRPAAADHPLPAEPR
jgi:hypothetical protein